MMNNNSLKNDLSIRQQYGYPYVAFEKWSPVVPYLSEMMARRRRYGIGKVAGLSSFGHYVRPRATSSNNKIPEASN